MSVPSSVLDGVESALEAHAGKAVRIASTSPVGGGCINPSAQVTTENGDSFFLKWNPAAARDMFTAEADGLRALRNSGALRIPEVIGEGGSGISGDPGWLLLEFIPKGRADSDYGERIGEGLADLHNSVAPDQNGSDPALFGWHRENFIGSLPQHNDPCEDWPTFWREFRLEPQLRMARDGGHFRGGRGSVLDELLSRLDEVMTGAGSGGPALLHGDLWSGNYYADASGEPVLIDPAVYRGVGEVDLAMMELFGSFPRGFRAGYQRRRELPPEYDAFRRDLYQLYYLLVHVNLFGGGYVSGSLAAAERVLRGY
jgi:fructosamine-3-kinase